MPPPVDRDPQKRESRPDFDRAWLWRALLAVVVIALVLLIAKVALMAFGGASRRVDVGVVDQSDTRAPVRLQVSRKGGW